jgi:hypothetical protein
VTKVRFSADDRYLVSTGGNDMTVLVWSTDVNSGLGGNDEQEADYSDDPDDPANESKIDRGRAQREAEKIAKQKAEQEAKKAKAAAAEDCMFEEEDLGVGDEFLAVIPWKGQCKPPTGFKRAPKGANEAPSIELQLEWVHGYKGDSAKNNLRYMADGTLCYYIAGVGVVLNTETHTQKFF